MKEFYTCELIATEALRIKLFGDDKQLIREFWYPLKKVSEEELSELRNSYKPIFILKNMEVYFYTELDIRFNLYNNKLFDHMCNNCKKCYPKSCLKVRDRDKRLENYDFILEGAEIINMIENHNSFVVKFCMDFEES